MTQFFSQKDIDEYREAFYLFAQKGVIENAGHLSYMMRCIGYSPTIAETNKYYKANGDKMDFAVFLQVVHEHSKRPTASREMLSAFRCHDRSGRGKIGASELKSILMSVGERLSPKEVDRMLEEAGVDQNGFVRYEELVRAMSTPLPDYM